jgi:hypothetical protein
LITAEPLSWALFTDVAAALGVPIEPVFRANDESLVLVEPEMTATG